MTVVAQVLQKWRHEAGPMQPWVRYLIAAFRGY